MQKLLHERLREINDSWPKTIKIGKVDVHLYPVEAQALAYEIERYYIPRPRFEDGEPVEWCSDNIVWEDDCEGWAFNAIDMRGILLAHDMAEICVKAKMTGDGFVVRKQPKVLDADGVEINVGDTVWCDGFECKVIKVKEGTCPVYVKFTNKSTFWAKPESITHKDPDSLEKLMDDATKPQRQYYNEFIGHDVELRDDEDVNIAVHTHIINRAIAIERSA